MMKKGILILLVSLLVGCAPAKEEQVVLTFKDIDFVEYGSTFETKDCIEKTNGEIEEYPQLDTALVGKQKLSFVVVKGDQKETFEKEIEVKDTQLPIIELKKQKDEIEYNG